MKKYSMRMGLMMGLLGLCLWVMGVAQTSQDPGVMLRTAIEKEEVEGDLHGAIKFYKDIIEQYAGEKAIAAQAQLRIGLCYEKLGEKNLKQAREAFQKVIDNFPAQSNEIRKARERLDTLVAAKAAPVEESFSVEELDFFVGEHSMEAFGLSPDGTKMLGVEFDQGQNIVVVDLKEQKVEFITNHKWEDENSSWTYNPIWSPDGREIAYNANRQGPDGKSLNVATLDGQMRVLLSSEKYWFFPNAWLPDGTAIVTIRGEYKNDSQELGLVPRRGGEFRKLRSLNGNVATSGGSRPHACASLDGRFIAYTDRVSGGNKDIFIMKAEGGEPWLLLDHPAGASLPRWSPDGKHIAFVSMRHGSVALWAVEVGEGRMTGDPFLIQGGMQGSILNHWTSHGLVSVKWLGIRDIYLMELSPDTGKPLTEPKLLKYTPTGKNRYPTWSPEGKLLAFMRNDDRSGRHIVVTDPDGIDPHEFQIPRGYSRFTYLRWLPDGSGIGLACGDFEWRNFILLLDFATEKWEILEIPFQGNWSRFEWTGKGKTFFYSKIGMPEEGAGIYVRNPDSGEESLIYRNPKQRANFRWLNCSRDFRWLSFIESNTRLMVVNLETGESHEAYPKSGFSTWSPDGQRLLALKTYGEDDGYRKSVVTVSVVGGIRNEIEFGDSLPDRGRFRSPDWSPDGGRLAFSYYQGRSDILLYKNIIPTEKK